MRKRYFLLFILLAINYGVCYAQQDKKIDSLLAVLKIQKNDTDNVRTLIALSKQSLKIFDIPGAKKYQDEALLLAEKKRFKKGIQEAQINSGYIANTRGNMFMNKGNYPEALNNYLAALKIFEKYKFIKGIAGSHQNVGHIYWAQRNFPEALKHYLSALKIFEELKDKDALGGIYNNIGLVHENQGNYQEALKYYNDAIKMYTEAGNKWALIDRYFNIGFLYEDQGNYDEALKNHLAALKVSEEIGTKDGIAASYSNIADVYSKQGSLSESLKNYSQAAKLYQETGNKQGVGIAYMNMGAVNLFTKDLPLAKKNLEDALSIAKGLGSIEVTKNIYELMTKVDSAAGNWEEALRDHKSYIIYRDSLTGQETANKIMKSQMQYEFDKKEDSLKYLQALSNAKLDQQILLSRQQEQTLLLKDKEVALLSAEKQMQQLQMQKDSVESAGHRVESEKKQGQLVLLNKEKAIQTLELNRQKQLKKYLIAGIALLLVLAFFVYRNYRTRQQLKLQTIRNKIASDLHDDIGSTLSSISIFSQMAQQGSKEVIPLLETIGENSRRMLDAMADIVWTINPENDQFEKIILRMRSFAYELLGAKKIDFEFLADEEVTGMKLTMDVRKNLYLIFKEAINNMVKYSGADKALFNIKGEKNNLTMLIHDNGKGFDTGQSTSGNGLKNMKKRADEIGAQFWIDSKPGAGTTIELKLAV
jgi:signal transduction histidine kinase